MLYTVDVRKLPLVTNCYRIERRTVWSAVDPDNILVLVHEGACVFRIESNETTVNKGEAFLIPAGQEYVRRPAPGTSAVFTYLHFRTASPLIETEASRVRSWLEERKTLLTSDAIAEPGAVFEPLDTLCIGTHTRFGGDAEALAGRIAEALQESHAPVTFVIPFSQYGLLGQIRPMGRVITENHTDTGTEVTSMIAREDVNRLISRYGAGIVKQKEETGGLEK